MLLHKSIINAYKVLDGLSLTREDALDLALNINGENIIDLISLANKVCVKFANKVSVCSIVNAKSGKCSQNCKFCAQNVQFTTGIKTYPILSKEEVLDAAKKVYEKGVRIFGYVTSGRGYSECNSEFYEILETLDSLHNRFPDMKICMSVGILNRTCAKLLSEHHVWRYNMNLQTNPASYAKLVATTHKIEEKIQTIKYLQEFDITNCTGGILGLGETWEDRIDLAFAIKELNVECSPLNVLLPIKGSALENQQLMDSSVVAKCFSIFRLINPTQDFKFAAGRETIMKDWQGLLMLSGINSIIVGGYLTTRGRDIDSDLSLIKQLDSFR